MSPPEQRPSVRQWLAEPLKPEVSAALDRLTRAEDVRHIAIMPDVHLAGEVCIGCVLATTRLIYPDAVGGDIGCGMAAVAFDCGADVLANENAAARVLAGLYECVPLNKHPRQTLRDRLPDSLQAAELSDPRLEKLKARDGRVQFGSLGRGNHFLEFQRDEHDRLWLMVHSGSRAMGQVIREHHLTKAVATATGLKALHAESEEGQAYLADACWAVDYAHQSRGAMMAAVAGLMRRLFNVAVVEGSAVNCDHNHVHQETHFGELLWVHRKGAMSAQVGEAGVIPGSMGTESFHVGGRGCEKALCSSSHGAGRAMSRDEARRRILVRQVERDLRGVWFDLRRANSLREESPSAYKDIRAVMRAQKELTRIVHTLTSLLCYKAG